MTALQRELDDVRLAEQLFEALASLRRQARGVAGRPWPDAPLTGAQVDLVRLLRRQPGLPVGAAAEALRLAPNTVSTLVRQLTAAGVVHREPDPDDRRVGRLNLTPAARQRLEGWRDLRSELTARALVELGDDDRAALAGAVPALHRLVAALARTREDA